MRREATRLPKGQGVVNFPRQFRLNDERKGVRARDATWRERILLKNPFDRCLVVYHCRNVSGLVEAFFFVVNMRVVRPN